MAARQKLISSGWMPARSAKRAAGPIVAHSRAAAMMYAYPQGDARREDGVGIAEVRSRWRSRSRRDAPHGARVRVHADDHSREVGARTARALGAEHPAVRVLEHRNPPVPLRAEGESVAPAVGVDPQVHRRASARRERLRRDDGRRVVRARAPLHLDHRLAVGERHRHRVEEVLALEGDETGAVAGARGAKRIAVVNVAR